MDFDDPASAQALLRGLKGRTIADIEVHASAPSGAPVLFAVTLDDGRTIVVAVNPEDAVLSVYLDADLAANVGRERSMWPTETTLLVFHGGSRDGETTNYFGETVELDSGERYVARPHSDGRWHYMAVAVFGELDLGGLDRGDVD